MSSENDCRLKTISEMIVTVSHEINNPLQVISGIAEILLEESDLKPDTRESVRTIVDMTEKIQNSVKRIQEIRIPKTSSYTKDIDMLDIEPKELKKK